MADQTEGYRRVILDSERRWPRCQFCKKEPAGMMRWPTKDDDYACGDCIREKYSALGAELATVREERDGVVRVADDLDSQLTDRARVIASLAEQVSAIEATNRELKTLLREALGRNLRDLDDSLNDRIAQAVYPHREEASDE